MFANTMKTGLLMFGLVALFTAIGGLLGNQTGALIGLLIAGGMSFYSYWFSDTTTIKAYNGIEVTAASNPRLYGIVQRLAQRANLPMPKVYIIPERQPNHSRKTAKCFCYREKSSTFCSCMYCWFT